MQHARLRNTFLRETTLKNEEHLEKIFHQNEKYLRYIAPK